MTEHETSPRTIMIRVRITKPNSKYKVGDTVVVSNNEAFGLIDSGVAVKTKDMTPGVDYKVKRG